MTYNLMIVDDSKLARMAATKALKTLYPEWNRFEAANADEALALARQTPVNIALLDFNMPGRDGLQLAADLRTAYPAMQIAVISANHQDEVVAKARSIGAVFLPKPLTEQALGEFLRNASGKLK
jgi:DNA-binding NarL/FixJ family response regulator